MAKITQDMKDIAAKARIFVVATSSKDGKPNAVPIGLAKIISDDEVMLADNFMHKTRQNLDENPMVGVTFWSMKDAYGYQFKGKARVETSGRLLDEAHRELQEREFPFTPKAVVVVKVDEIYYVGPGKDSSKNLV
jgi:predicted pyridoxine 5'-phosphate oxidase superfamily flavin-nucleotide-binding protein